MKIKMFCKSTKTMVQVLTAVATLAVTAHAQNNGNVFGTDAGNITLTGYGNTGYGSQALHSNTTGNYN